MFSFHIKPSLRSDLARGQPLEPNRKANLELQVGPPNPAVIASLRPALTTSTAPHVGRPSLPFRSLAMPRRPRTSTGSRQRGRPTLDDANRRTHTVGVRLSPTELAELDAVRGTVSRGAWLREAALNASARRAVPAPPAINIETWRQLAGAANNLNQLVAWMHQHNKFTDEVRETVNNIRELVLEVQVQLLVRE